MKNAVIYVHGQGGTPEEAEHYAPLFPGYDVFGFSYTSQTPREAIHEFSLYYRKTKERYQNIIWIANSLGAYFTLISLSGKQFEKVYLISPIVDMKILIESMMTRAGVTPDELAEKGEIATDFGQTLCFDYYQYVCEHPAAWTTPTDVIYGTQDHLTSESVIRDFCLDTGSNLHILPGGEHWFHTPEQMDFIDSVLKEQSKEDYPVPLLAAAVLPLIAWYRGSGRPMPWRLEPTPYRVWISEVMLQQTRIAAVIPYFERFMKALPTVRDLAEIPEEQLLKLWEGLGYYSRARNLKKAAVEIVEKFGGELPASKEALLSLPGVGAYTAGAIASIAYGLPCPAVDGNVLRVIARLCNNARNILEDATKKDVTAVLEKIYPSGKDAAALSQALMELGESLCVPQKPRCTECPLAEICQGLIAGTVGELPIRNGKKERKIQYKTVFLLECDGKYAIRKRSPRGLLASLWEFPSADEVLSPEEAALWAASRGLTPLDTVPIGTATHVFTHIEWHMTGYRVSCRPAGGDFLWASPEEIRSVYALPRAFRAFLAQI